MDVRIGKGHRRGFTGAARATCEQGGEQETDTEGGRAVHRVGGGEW